MRVPAFPLTYSPFLVRAALKSEVVAIEQMADDFRVIAASKGDVDAGDLKLIGWTPEQIAKHGDIAAMLAMRRAERRSDKNARSEQRVAS
jgi:hypothetical protein